MVQGQPRTEENAVHDLIEEVRQVALPLRGVSDLDPLMDRIGEARFILLGEASHGPLNIINGAPALVHA